MPEQATGVTQWSEAVGDAATVLLLAPSFEQGVGDVCTDLLAGPAPAETEVVAVTYTQRPTRWMADWLDRTGVAPAGGLIVCIDDGASGEAEPATVTAVDVAYLDNAANLTELGVQLSEALAGGEERPVRLCFDSLTVLLQYATTDQAFRFLHALTSRVRAAGAVAHFHLDPAAHDEQTLSTVQSLFDAVVAVEDGEWTVTAS